ncbi:hypothetical protein [Rhodovulum steppense]|uniref:hypothetical protein n=1 Tax=Rhodovulum steppense TaxID=540251 RepID=UPI00140549B1|nr:hypothetical protein [Rhodovulum steppense]
MPWEIDSIDQLIGRVDRLGATGERKGGRRVIDIWRILIEGSQETAIADTVAELGVFDSPLPPLSPNLERRRQAPPEAGPVELWQGQVAALERSLSMARLNFSEATDFLQGLAAGHHPARTVQPGSRSHAQTHQAHRRRRRGTSRRILRLGQ